jgi:ABC-2 type transport system permease protein
VACVGNRRITALPVMLFLFGYAINTDPKHLPTGLLAVDHSQYGRTLVAALQNTGYYDIKPSPAAMSSI